ncbi:MAG: hypothetical protein ACOX4P_07965 [Anaerovoracaceae bacterium]|jgi:medium-chain acyl-[acyl-carrier-protein] hydrolase
MMGTDIKKQEYTCVYELDVEVAQLNENNALKPGAYQTLFARLADMHLANYNVDINETMKYGFGWALISLSFEVVHPINSCMRLYASTWYSQRKGPYFRRELVFRNKQGQIMFHGSTFSVLLDIKNRTVFRKKETPFHMNPPYELFCIEANPRFRERGLYKDVETRKVHNSYMDCLGHVNNCRYGDFAYDALDDEQSRLIGDLKRMDAFFSSELRKNDEFTVQKSVDGNQIFIKGHNIIKDDAAFHIVFQF